MIGARAAAAVIFAGFLAGYLFNGPDVWGRFLLVAFVLLVVAGVVDVRSIWRAAR